MTTELPTISVDEVQAAYKQLEIRPLQGHFFIYKNGNRDAGVCWACALSVLWLAQHRESPSSPAVIQWAIGRYGRAYTLGFMAGFDKEVCEDAHGRAVLGMEHGQAVQRAMWPSKN